jgi:hypothetical protein
MDSLKFELHLFFNQHQAKAIRFSSFLLVASMEIRRAPSHDATTTFTHMRQALHDYESRGRTSGEGIHANSQSYRCLASIYSDHATPGWLGMPSLAHPASHHEDAVWESNRLLSGPERQGFGLNDVLVDHLRSVFL